MTKITSITAFVFVLCLQHAVSYRILGVFPHTGSSHHVMFEPLLRELAERGHELTVISHYPMRDPPANYTDVSLAGTMPLNVHVCDFDQFLFLSGVGAALRHAMATYELFDLARLNCGAMASHRAVRELVASQNRTFDAILTEQFNSDCALGVAAAFGDAPIIGVATHVPMPWTWGRFGVRESAASVPNHFLKHCRRPTVWEAAESYLVGLYYKVVYYLSTHYVEYFHLKGDYLKTRDDLDEVAKRFSLLLVTTYFPLHGSLALAPNVIEIGGIHLPNKQKQIDEDIKSFLDDAHDGAIYFSMGSMIRGKSLPSDKLTAFQRAFARLNQVKVLWKWENETMPGITPNIMIKQWMPQYEILSHKNVKAFVCHGGLLGLTEAVHHGVPVLVIPFFGDQFVNGMAAQESGLGRVLEYDDITEESIVEAMKDLLSPKMVVSTKKLSAIWKHRQSSPLDTAVHWIEHVAKFGGSHLRPNSADLPLVRYLMLDVFLVLGIAFLVLAYVYYKIGRCLLKYFFESNAKRKTD